MNVDKRKNKKPVAVDFGDDSDSGGEQQKPPDPNKAPADHARNVRFVGVKQTGAEEGANERTPWMMADRNDVAPIDPHGHGLALFEDEYAHKPKVAHIIRTLSIYTPLQPGTSLVEKAARTQATMGTFMGVFLPCIQNIFGVLFFIRLAWIVGTAGLLQSIFIVLICCLVTFTTSISLSAIATNGMVPAGGPYYMISRNLGPELGGAVGILFYLGTTVAASMYITGAAEIFLLYLVPQAKIFQLEHCYRLYGTLVLIFLALIVMAGVGVVNKFALPTVIIVNLCILLSFIGVFYNINGNDKLQYCMVGDRLVNRMIWLDQHPGDRIECDSTALRKLFCKNETDGSIICDKYFSDAVNASTIQSKPAIKGLLSNVIKENFDSNYMEAGVFLSENETQTQKKQGTDKESSDKATDQYVYADISSSFIILVGVFFPSVTGIMAGSNRSGDLKDASKSIPRGTIAATTVTSFCYLLGTILFAASFDEVFIRDKFGQSAFGALAVAEICVPHPKVLVVGSLIATTGAGMQSLTGAPRLLQAIARDGVIPLLAPFQQTTKRGEPLRAILLTLGICELGILIAELESITALISQFFLMCYLGVNSACALQSLLNAPSWRPRFRYYHWSLSMFGAVLCVAVMFMSNWAFAIVAFVIGVAVYKYIEYRGAEKEWGDGLRGLGLSAARYALLNLEEGPVHTKNWRPQLLILCSLTPEYRSIKHERLLAFASQMKAGKGLTVIATVIEGRFPHMSEEVFLAKKTLKEAREKYKIKGFCEALVSPDLTEAISALIQTSGLGGLKHNTLILNWPHDWNEREDFSRCQMFVEALRSTTAAKCAALVIKNIDSFPDVNERMTGKIDVWWVVHDGGMLMLLPFLLRQHKSWRSTRLRVFTVAHQNDNSQKMKEDLEKFLYHLRIEAEAHVFEMQDTEDLSEYAYERTLKMFQRSQLLREVSEINEKDKAQETQSSAPVVEPDHQNLEYVDLHNDESEQVENSLLMPSNADSLPTQETAKNLLPVSVSGNKIDPRRMPPPPSPRLDSNRIPNGGDPLPVGGITPPKFIGLNTYNVRRMHTASKLNEAMKSKSVDAQLLFVNLPGPPKSGSEEYYMEFIEVLTEGLDRVVLVKGTGTEVVTIYS